LKLVRQPEGQASRTAAYHRRTIISKGVGRAFKNASGVNKVEAMFFEVDRALALRPGELHVRSVATSSSYDNRQKVFGGPLLALHLSEALDDAHTALLSHAQPRPTELPAPTAAGNDNPGFWFPRATHQKRVKAAAPLSVMSKHGFFVVVGVVDQQVEHHALKQIAHLLALLPPFGHAAAVQQLRQFRVARDLIGI